MFDKIREALALIRQEESKIRKDLDKALQRIEDLKTLPLPRDDFADSIIEMFTNTSSEYPEDLKKKLSAAISDPLKTPNYNSWSPLAGFKAGDVNPAALNYIFKAEIINGIRSAIAEWPWPADQGPTRAERTKELVKLEKTIDDLQSKLEKLRAESAAAGISMGSLPTGGQPIHNRVGGFINAGWSSGMKTK